MSDLDLDAIRRDFLQQCGPHDYGILAADCACPEADFRPVMYALLAEVERLQRELDDARVTIRAFVKPAQIDSELSGVREYTSDPIEPQRRSQTP